MLGLYHRSYVIVMLKVRLHCRNSRMVELEVGFHHRCFDSDQEVS